jgi:hypothetical protein
MSYNNRLGRALGAFFFRTKLRENENSTVLLSEGTAKNFRQSATAVQSRTIKLMRAKNSAASAAVK